MWRVNRRWWCSAAAGGALLGASAPLHGTGMTFALQWSAVGLQAVWLGLAALVFLAAMVVCNAVESRRRLTASLLLAYLVCGILALGAAQFPVYGVPRASPDGRQAQRHLSAGMVDTVRRNWIYSWTKAVAFGTLGALIAWHLARAAEAGRQLERARRRVEEARSRLADTELDVLRARIDPSAIALELAKLESRMATDPEDGLIALDGLVRALRERSLAAPGLHSGTGFR